MKPEQTGHEPCGCGSDQLREKLPSTGEIQSVADAMRQLGDSSRLRIFWVLCHCEECVMGLSALVEMSSPAVSHHLRLLKSAGLIVSRRQGKEMYYRAADVYKRQGQFPAIHGNVRTDLISRLGGQLLGIGGVEHGVVQKKLLIVPCPAAVERRLSLIHI